MLHHLGSTLSVHYACISPALVDVDVVDLIGANGDLGQGLDHVVALQDDVSLSFGGRKQNQHQT